MDQEVKTFFPADNKVCHFEQIMMKGMMLRDPPYLHEIYFVQCKRVLYIAQTNYVALVEKIRQAIVTQQLDITIAILDMAILRHFFTVCAVDVSHPLPLA